MRKLRSEGIGSIWKGLSVLVAVTMVTAAVSMSPAAAASQSGVTTVNDCGLQTLAQAIAKGDVIDYGIACDVLFVGSSGSNVITVPSSVTASVDANGNAVTFLNDSLSGRGARMFLVDGSLSLRGINITGASLKGVAGRSGRNGQAGGTAQGAAFYLRHSGRLNLTDCFVSLSYVVGGKGGEAVGSAGSPGQARAAGPSQAGHPHGGRAGTGGTGGIAEGGAVYNDGTMDAVNTQFLGDQARGGTGGASVGGSGAQGGSYHIRGMPGYKGDRGGIGGIGGVPGAGGYARGGAIYNAGTLTVFESQVSDNLSLGGSGGASIGGPGGSGGSGILGEGGGAGGPGGRSSIGGSGGTSDGGAIDDPGSARAMASVMTGNAAVGGPGGLTLGGRGGRGGRGGAGTNRANGGAGGSGGVGGLSLQGGSGGMAAGGAVSSTGPQSFAGALMGGNRATGGRGGASVGAAGGDGARGGRAARGHGRVAMGGAGGSGGDGAAPGNGGQGGNAEGPALFATGPASGDQYSILVEQNQASSGRGGASSRVGLGGRGARGGDGNGKRLRGRGGFGGLSGVRGSSGRRGAARDQEFVTLGGFAAQQITVSLSGRANRRAERVLRRTAQAFAADYASPPVASSHMKLTLDVPRSDLRSMVHHASRIGSAKAIPTFTSSFKTKDGKYRYTMVGTNPTAGSRTTAVHVLLVPLSVNYAGRTSLDASTAVAQLLNSPIFQNASYTSGNTQYVDAMQRAEFWTEIERKAAHYHLLLDRPTVSTPVTFNVPASLGFVTTSAGAPDGLADIFSWDAALHQLVTQQLKASPDTVVITITPTTELFDLGCCAGGYHTAYLGRAGVNTVMWNDAPAPGQFLGIGANNDLVISHEAEEWANDPYINNNVPAWIQPGTGQCFSNLLEVGDVIEALPHPTFGVPLNGQVYQVQDVAGLSWFADQKPSMEQNGLYSYDGKLTAPAKYC